MGKIQRLPSELANQIAAGEVVERPASAVKELIENALDAGARRIAIAVELGGKKLMRVDDDGEGMEPEDARVALERHATSKLRHLQDLGAIRTLGFRGEALPSIASVSHLTLRTCTHGSGGGTEIRVNGGATVSIKEVGAAEGTVVEVADLFYNVPARRKFLKSDAAESAQVSRLVTQLALGYPEVGFVLTSAGRRVLQCPPVKTLAERFFQVYGERADLIEVRKEAAGLRLYGYIAALAEHGPVRGLQHIFVNRRIVKDRTISHAIGEAYSAATIKERSPEVCLFLELAPDRVDVNVHPMKAEVRFLEQSLVHEVLRRALGEALGQGRAPELQVRASAAPAPTRAAQPTPGVLGGAFYTGRWAPVTAAFARPEHGEGGGFGVVTGASGAVLGQPVSDQTLAQAGADPAANIRAMIPLGQFRDTFIIAVDAEGVAIIDQHVAHERVLFEQVMERLTAGRLESQRLLEPMLVDLSASQREALAAHGAELQRFGFDVEDFGGDSLRIAAVPALLRHEESAAAMRALAEDLEGLDRGSPVEDALRRIAATTACHAAVKANDRLTFDKMTHILDELRRTAYSTVCPHGRPVVLRLTRREIEKKFQRI